MLDRRALAVHDPRLGIRPDQRVEVAALELVGIGGQRLQVGHPVVIGAGGEGSVWPGQRGQGGEASGRSSADGQPIRIDVLLLAQPARRGQAILHIDDAPGLVQ